MDIAALFENKLFVAVFSAADGILVTVIAQYLLNKRGVFSYQVFELR